MSNKWSDSDREFAIELLREGSLSDDEEILLMDRIEEFDRQKSVATQIDAENKQWTHAVDLEPTVSTYKRNPDRGGVLGTSAQGIVRQISPPSQENPDLQIRVENAAARGVDTTTGLRRQVRGAAGLIAFDKGLQAEALERSLREEYEGANIPANMPLVFQDESTGMPMYMRLTEQGTFKPTLINPPGADIGDVYELGGELPTIALETLGGVTGAIGGSSVAPGAGTVAGGTVGAAAGGAASIPVRVWLAERAGVPRDILDKIKVGDEAAWQAALSGGGELLGFGVEGAVTGLRNFFGRPLDVDDLPALEAEITRRQAKVDELQARRQAMTGEEPTPIELSLGELTGDADILTAEANIMNQQAGKTAREMRARQINTDKSTRQALRDLATQDVRGPADEGFRSVEDVSQDVRHTLADEPRAELDGLSLEAQTELTSAQRAAQVDSTLDDLAKVRDNVHAHAELLHTAEGQAWANYRSAVRWDPETRTSGVFVDNRGPTPIREVATRLERDQKGALLQSLANSYEGTLRNMGFSPKEVGEMVDPNDLTGLSQDLLDPFHLHMALSHMKKELRLLEAGDSSRGWEAGDLREVITAIEDTMKMNPMVSSKGRQLADSTTSSVRAAWVEANERTRRLHNLLDTKNMRALLDTKVKIGPDGTSYSMPNLPPQLLRNRILVPGDARFLMEAVEAVGHDPRIKLALASEMRRAHADAAIREGRWSQTGHNDFMEQYADHLRFLGIDPDISNIAQFGRRFDELKVGLETFEKKLVQRYGVTTPDPARPLNIAKEILSDRINFKQARDIMGDLERLDPALASSVREKVLERLDLDLTASNNKVLSRGKLSEILTNQRETLAAVFNPKYVQDLDLLEEILDFQGERVFQKSTKELIQTHFVALTRSLFGPLSKKQRFLTSVQRVARHTRAGSVSKLLSEPNALRNFVRLKNLSVRDPRYWIIVRGLGLTEYALDGDDKAQQAYEDFVDGTLQQEMLERQTPTRYGFIQ